MNIDAKNNIYLDSKTPLETFNWGLESLLKACSVLGKNHTSEGHVINYKCKGKYYF